MIDMDFEKLKQKARKLDEENPDLMMMSAIDCIVQLAEGSGFGEEFLSLSDRYITYLSDKQGISRIQAVLLSLFVEHSASGFKTSLSDIASRIGCSNIKVLKYQKEVDGLVNMGLLRKCKNELADNNAYCIPCDIFTALVDDKPYCKESYKGLTGIQLFQKYYEISKLRKNDELSTTLLIDEVERLFDDNENLDYVRSLRNYKLDKMEEILVTQLCMYPVLFEKDIISMNWLRFLFDNQREECDYAYALQSGSHPLLRKGIIEPAFNEGFGSNEEFTLKDSARRRLLKGLAIKMTGMDNCYQMPHQSIIAKELFFDRQVEEQLNRLYRLVDEKEYRHICKRLKEKGMRPGVACLFYGAPGTGKTESVLQLAKKSGRDILQVNISDVKSKWVGESEKNVKAIFDRYRMMSSHSKKAPILLFNEADAVLGSRKEGAGHSVDKMENSIQNIILQEMETMNGIMIATTNLVQNLDKAFERRFLYKVKFDKPSFMQRQSIWKSFIPVLSGKEVEQIAGRYDFSGGQIENISRKCNIDSVLYGDEYICLDKINQYCQEETIVNNNRIGF